MCDYLNNCNLKKDGCTNSFCLKKYKLDYLFKLGLFSDKQKIRMPLNLDDDEKDLKSFNKLSMYDKDIVNFVDSGKNLYIHSTICGNSKTSWALRLAQSYLNNIYYFSNLECKILFISVPRFLLELKDDISTKSDYIRYIKDNVLKANLVIWDDIGFKGGTEFECSNLLNMIDSRINMNKSNIYTSNLNDRELHKCLGDRLHSRIVNNSINIEFFGKDKRGRIKE